MSQGIFIVYWPTVSVMISKQLRILLFDCLPIYHSYFLLITLHHIQTWYGWHNHNIIIRFLHNKNIKLCVIPFTTKISHITNHFYTEISINYVSMNTYRRISYSYQWTSIPLLPLPNLQDSFRYTEYYFHYHSLTGAPYLYR